MIKRKIFGNSSPFNSRIAWLPSRHWQLILAAGGLVMIASLWPSAPSQVNSGKRQALSLPGVEFNNDGFSGQPSYVLPESKAKADKLAVPEAPTQAEPQLAQAVNQADATEQSQTSQNLAQPAAEQAAEQQLAPIREYHYTIAKGDTLGSIFDKFKLSHKTMYQLLEADVEVLALDTLRPGHELAFWIKHETQSLEKIRLSFNPAQHVVFTRVDESNFEFDTIHLDGEWEREALSGDIEGSFYVSAQKAGLSANEIEQVARLFKDKLNFSRDLRSGDSFQVVRNRQYIDQELSGISEISAIIFNNRGREFTAYLYEDGNYYDKDGESLARAFMRVPLKRQYRISSHHNPRRRHPVTGRVAPHNGTDFATPIGTPVLAAGDGVISRIENHPYAGKYIVIEHGGKYRSRYLHLHKFKVRRGQAVKRGEVIALTGNTGRSTGPHLHYEFHINGRPVNPMRAKIPQAESIDSKERANFASFVGQMNQLLGAS